MFISDYPEGSLDSSSFMMVDDGEVKKLPADPLLWSVLSMLDPVNHRMFFRGKNLGSEITDEQFLAIANGSFTDLWLGDYWTDGNKKWRIWDFNYWGDNPYPHIVIMPDEPLYTTTYDAIVEKTAGTFTRLNMENGYFMSGIKTSGLGAADDLAGEFFGLSKLFHREGLMYIAKVVDPSQTEYVSGSHVAGAPVRVATLNSHNYTDLPSEQMIYGFSRNLVENKSNERNTMIYNVGQNEGYTDQTCIYSTSAASDDALEHWYDGPLNIISDRHQLALARIAPSFINCGQSYMLRDAAPDGSVVFVSNLGLLKRIRTSSDVSAFDLGVRPVFGITGE